MGQDPGEIREEIEATRDRMSHTADALAAKADVRSRARDTVTASKQRLVEKTREMGQSPLPAVAGGGVALLLALAALLRRRRRRRRTAGHSPRYYTAMGRRPAPRPPGRRERVVAVYRTGRPRRS